MGYESKFPPVYVTVDVVVLTVRPEGLAVLLVERGAEPQLGILALPGGFVRQDESLVDGARRELLEETGIVVEPTHLEQLASYGAVDRDPRARTVSVAYLAVLPRWAEPTPGTDAAGAAWHVVDDLTDLELAFDHSVILRDGVERLRAKIEYTPLATAFCEDEFTIRELRTAFEAIWGHHLDAGNFHRKVLSCRGLLHEIAERDSTGPGRPARRYRRGSAAELRPPLYRS